MYVHSTDYYTIIPQNSIYIEIIMRHYGHGHIDLSSFLFLSMLPAMLSMFERRGYYEVFKTDFPNSNDMIDVMHRCQIIDYYDTPHCSEHSYMQENNRQTLIT